MEEKRVISAKTQRISFMFKSMEIMNEVLKNDKKAVMTFVTSMGYIVGEEFIPVDLSEENSYKEDGIDSISLARDTYLKFIDQNKDNIVLNDEDSFIHLKNVKIYPINMLDKPLETERMTLFTNQVISVIPGELSIEVKK